MRTTFQIIAFAVCIVFSAQSQAQTGEIFPKGELSTTKNHTGNIWLNELNVGDSTFDAGAGRIADKIAAINLPAGLTLAVSPICGTSSPTDCSSPFSKRPLELTNPRDIRRELTLTPNEFLYGRSFAFGVHGKRENRLPN